MWYLESPRGEVYKVTPGRVHTVSRKNGDIVLANDQSVSRKHAFLEVRTPMTEGIAVWDESSKYGTFVDDEITRDKRLTAGSKRIVKEGAKIRFGLQEINIWTLKVEKLCVCAHMLRPIEKSKVKSVLNVMGHELVDNWVKEATHLTTNYLSLSYEVLCALASAKPIVLPEFWQHYAHMVRGEGALPDPAKFMPPLEDSSSLGSRKACLPNVQRKTLFVDKTFIFSSSRSFNALKTVIATAGGKALKMSDCGLSLADYCKPNVVVLDCEEDHETSFYNRVLSTLLDNNLRIIPVQDIGLALWKVSTSTHCNPKHTPNSVLRRPTDSERDEGATIVMNTEDIDASLTGVDIHDDQVIPPSLTETHATDDATMSMSVRATEKTSPAGPSRKRFRENSVERQNSNSVKVSRGKNSVKKEPEEEEDMFAFEDYPSRPSTSNNSSSTHFTSTSNNSSSKRLKNGLNSFVAKEDKHADDDDGGFTFNPPPKKKKIKQQEEEEDLFELPKAPSPNANRNDEDEFDFLSSSKLSKSMRDAKLNLHEESRDMFQTEDLPSTSSSSTRGEKRKGTGDTESESPPFKKPSKPCLDVTNVHNSQKHSKSITGFLTKRDNSFIKTEIKTDADEETDLSDQLCAKVVIRSLLRKPQVNGHNNTSVNSTEKRGKNFKKFKKVWSGSATKHHITTSRVRTFGGHTLNSTGMEEEDQDDDDPFIPSRPAARRQNGKRNNINDQDDDDDDEFALPAMSQCM